MRRSSAGLGYRPDLDALRCVAVVLVVGYHAGIPGFHAGFVGVDVFFVLSGFLITIGLLADAERGQLSLARFWARRIGRLLPLATAVIAVTVLASLATMNPLDWDGMLEQARVGTLYVANEHFADLSTDYFTADTRTSPFLHLWSLSVEEQFYLCWPILVGAAVWLAARRRRPDVIGLALWSAVAVSAILSWWATASGGASSYYALFSRAWELGAGAVLACAWPAITQRRGGTATRSIVTAVGLFLLLAGREWIAAGAPFPMWGAVPVVLGTAAIIVGQPTAEWVGGRWALGRPVLAIGRWSYGWYLWHWPALVLLPLALGTHTMALRVAVAVGSLVLAGFTHRVLEHRLHGRTTATRHLYGAGIAMVTVTLAVIAGGHLYVEHRFSEPRMAALREAAKDHPSLEKHCASMDPEVLLEHCRVGSGADPVLLVGDSHAAHWLPAVEAVAHSLRRPTVRNLLGSCFAVGYGHDRDLQDCSERPARLPAILDALRPSAVVVAHASIYRDLRDSAGTVDPDQFNAWRRSHEALAIELRERDIPLLVILDTPRYHGNPLRCLAAGTDEDSCTVASSEVRTLHRTVNRAIEQALTDAEHGTTFDPVPLMCAQRHCDLLDGSVVVMQDGHHITRTYARRLAPAIGRALGASMRPCISRPDDVDGPRPPERRCPGAS